MATAMKTPKSTDPTPLYALVGATDAAVESVRHALADASRRQAEVQAQVERQLEQLHVQLTKRRDEVAKLLGEPKRLQAELEQVPGLVFGRTLEAAAKAETRYEALAERGKSLVERLRSQKTTQDLLDQGMATISRTKVAVATARLTAEDVAASARETIGLGKRDTTAEEASIVADTTAEEASDTEETEENKDSAPAGRPIPPRATKPTATTPRKRVIRKTTTSRDLPRG